MRKTYYYLFSDGYECWTAGKLKGVDRRNEIFEHGSIIKEDVEYR